MSIRNTAYKKVMQTALISIVGVTLSNNLLVTTAKANEQSHNNLENNIQQIEKVATNSNLKVDFLNTRLYKHVLENKDVITLQFKNIPLLTFFPAPNSSTEETAMGVADNLENLAQDSINATEIIVKWNQETKDYSIQYQDKELVRINQYIRLPDSNNNLSEDALQATNRMRRLIGSAKPLSKIEGKPKKIAKSSTTNNQSFVKSSRKSHRGQASWYGPGFHGRRTASGEIFNQNALTAAHKTLPFGTKVKITNMRNGRSVIVRINDRGPYSGGRIVDLSAAAARVIGMKSSGVAPVNMQILSR